MKYVKNVLTFYQMWCFFYHGGALFKALKVDYDKDNTKCEMKGRGTWRLYRTISC